MLCVYSKINACRGFAKNKKMFFENNFIEEIILTKVAFLRY